MNARSSGDRQRSESSPRIGLGQRVAWRAAEIFTSPAPPQEFGRLFNRVLSSRQLLGRVTAVHRETENSATIEFKPAAGWDPHLAGQWARIGVEIDGVRHWRSYSLSSAAGQDPAITVTAIGLVSHHLVHETSAGDVLFLAPPQGDFVLPSGPRPLLMLTAGSGLTPVMSMLRTLLPARPDADVVLIHSIRERSDMLFDAELEQLEKQHTGLHVVRRITGTQGRLDLTSGARDLNTLCPDWRSRKTFVCGPEGLLEAAEALWRSEGVPESLSVERFTTTRIADPESRGGVITFERSDHELVTEGNETILEAAEAAGVMLPSGCRMGICRTCLTPLRGGTVRNLATGQLCADEGELIQTCINSAVGPIRLDA